MTSDERRQHRWSGSQQERWAPKTGSYTREELLALRNKRDKARPEDELRRLSTSSPLDPLASKSKVLSAGFFGLPEGRTVHGWIQGIEGSRSPLIVRIDDRRAGSVREIGSEHDQNVSTGSRSRARFIFHSPIELLDGKRHRIDLVEPDSNVIIASREVLGEQKKGYKDFDSFLRWLYWRRECFAPFSNFDRRCISYMAWLAQYLASRSPREKPDQPLVSIVMTASRKGQDIDRPIRSALEQSYENWELVLVHDGRNASTVQSFEDSRIKHLHSEAVPGADETRTLGLPKCKGGLVAYLSEDSWWDPRYLELMVGVLNDNPEYRSVFCAQYLFDGAEGKPFALRGGPFNPSLIENRSYIDLSAFVHRQEIGDVKVPYVLSAGGNAAWNLIRRCAAEDSPYFLPCVLSNRAIDRWQESQDLLQSEAAEDMQPDVGRITEISPSGSPPRKTPQRTDVSVVVPSYNIPDVLTICIEQLVATVDMDRTQIIICDNGSAASTREAIGALKDKHANIVVEFLDRNYGFSFAVNRGMEIANPENDVVVLNNDAIPTSGWLSALEAVLLEYPDVGIVAPQQVLLPGTATALDHAPFADLEVEIDVNVSPLFDNLQSWDAFGSKKLLQLTFAPFFCVLISRALIDRIGYLDEKRGRHYESDRIFCNATRNIARKKIVYTWHSRVYHLLQQSTKDLRNRDVKGYEAMFKRNDWSDFQSTQS